MRVSPDFADRVVRAAVAEAEKQQVALAPSRQSARRRLAIAAGAVAALAACLLLFLRPWQGARPEPGPVIVKTDPIESTVPIETRPVEKTVAKVRGDQGPVFGMRSWRPCPATAKPSCSASASARTCGCPRHLIAALNKAGISPLASDAHPPRSRGRNRIAACWKRSMDRRLVVPMKTLLTSTVAAAEALLSSAAGARRCMPATLSETVKQPLAINAEGKLVLARGPNTEKGEGEFAVSQPFAQRLNAGLFRLEKKLAEAATAAVSSPTAAR